MKIKIAIFLAVIGALVAARGAYAQFCGGPGFCTSGGGGGGPPVLTNLRITNTGDFRVTNTGDNRAVFP